MGLVYVAPQNFQTSSLELLLLLLLLLLLGLSLISERASEQANAGGKRQRMSAIYPPLPGALSFIAASS